MPAYLIELIAHLHIFLHMFFLVNFPSRVLVAHENSLSLLILKFCVNFANMENYDYRRSQEERMQSHGFVLIPAPS